MVEMWGGTGVTSSVLRMEVERLAGESPARQAQCIYTNTVYNHDTEEEVPTTPNCIVGTAVYNLTGRLVPRRFEGSTINANIWRQALGEEPLQEPIWGNANALNSSEDFLFVLHLQHAQDDDYTWGEALRRATSRLG